MPIDIFISYRRADSGGHARSVRTGLLRWFDESQLFFDQETIPAGVEFAAHIAAALSECRVVLVAIGPDWLTAERDGQRRLLDPLDLVRQEVAQALAGGKHVIPVLMNDAAMPEGGQLPDELKGLAVINAHVQAPRKTFDGDLMRLAQLIAERGVRSRRQELAADRETLPLLCDRSDQHDAMKATVSLLVGNEQRRPFVLALHGPSDEEHWAFVERLQTFSMPRLLAGTPLSPGDRFIWINDALPVDCDQQSFDRRLRSDIATALKLGPVADDDALLRQLKDAKRSTLVVVLSWHIDELDRLPAQALQRLFNYWAQFPTTEPKMLAACVVCLKYDRPEPARRRWWHKAFGGSSNPANDSTQVAELKGVLKQSATEFAKDSRVAWSAPPALSLVTKADLERWRDEVRGLVAIQVSSEKLEAVLGGQPRSMEWVLPRLEALVTDT